MGDSQELFKKFLTSAKGNWKKAGKLLEERGKGGGYECPVEDGVYQAKVTKVELTKSGKGDPQVHWVYIVVSGKDKGEQLHDYDGLKTPENMFHFARKLATLDIEIDFDDPESIIAAVKKINKEQPFVTIRVKTTKNESTNKEYTHVYINRLLDEADIEDSGDDDEDDSDDDSDDEDDEKEEKKSKKSKKSKDEDEDEESEDEDEDDSDDEDEDDSDDEDEEDEDEKPKKDKKSKVKETKSKKDDDEDEESDDSDDEDEDSDDEDEDDEPADEPVEITEGSEVTWNKGKKSGKIKKFNEEQTKAYIITEDGKEWVAVDKLAPAETESEDADSEDEDDDSDDEEGDEKMTFKKGDRVKISGFSGEKSKGDVVATKGTKVKVDQEAGKVFWVEASKLKKIK